MYVIIIVVYVVCMHVLSRCMSIVVSCMSLQPIYVPLYYLESPLSQPSQPSPINESFLSFITIQKLCIKWGFVKQKLFRAFARPFSSHPYNYEKKKQSGYICETTLLKLWVLILCNFKVDHLKVSFGYFLNQAQAGTPGFLRLILFGLSVCVCVCVCLSVCVSAPEAVNN